MTVSVKICGLRDAASVAAAVEGGARYAGFVFYPNSPRVIEAQAAAALIHALPETVTPVGLFVDPADTDIMNALRRAPLRMLQLHGAETPERVNAIKRMTGLPLIKAVGISSAADLSAAKIYEPVADMLLFDAKPSPGGLPGGNATSFDWSLLKQASFTKPWMLAGGLNTGNIADAVAAGARILDVSSGVEDAPGRKNPALIKGFLAKAREIETCC